MFHLLIFKKEKRHPQKRVFVKDMPQVAIDMWHACNPKQEGFCF
jgi:hypothetical protein